MYSQDENSRRTHKKKHNAYDDKAVQSVAAINEKITNNTTVINNKLDFDGLRPMLNSLFDEILEQVTDRDRALECLARQLVKCGASRPVVVATTPTVNFVVPVGVTVAIPLQTLVDNHGDYHFSGGVITPRRQGWYNVYAHCYDSYAQAGTIYNLHIVGVGSIGLIDAHYGNRPFNMRGQQYVYCNGTTDTISMALSHAAGIPLNFNVPDAQHRSYLTVSYVGDQYSAFVV